MHDQSVLSVIVRRFEAAFQTEIQQSLDRLQDAATKQTGYLGGQNSFSETEGLCELVTVYAFDTRENLEDWEKSEARNLFLAELDKHPQGAPHRASFDGLTLLLHPRSTIRKFEIVLILIFWILLNGFVLGYVADLTLPEMTPPFLRQVLLVSVNVLLISYVLLPWSSKLLSGLKSRLSRNRNK